MILTRRQRVALRSVFNRSPIWPKDRHHTTCDPYYALPGAKPLTYREFRRRVIQFDYDAIGIHWAGIWLGIERDGYTHS